MKRYPLLLLCSVAMISSCATDDPNKRTKTGIAVGAIAGAVIGNQSSSKNGKYVGAVVGALSGAAVGRYMDKQQQQLERRLANERRNQKISMVRIDEETLRLDIRSDASFAVNSASLSSNFQSSLTSMAEILAEYDKTAIHIIGHTDSSGAQGYNQQLSLKRARSVSDFLVNTGVIQKRIRTSGRGENEPRFSNASSQSRRLNRRVEIYLKSIVKGREREAFISP